MEKSILKYTGWLMLVVLVVLLLLNFLPGVTIGGHVLRRVDILGDVRPVAGPVSEPDSLLLPPLKVKPAFVDTCRSGMTCIEDYSDSTLRGMTPFYRALDELSRHPRLVRIAVFGDSFIEADILTADLREMLQQQYGGCGVGFVTITSMTSGFRPHGAPSLRRLAKPFRDGLRLFRPQQAGHFRALLHTQSGRLCGAERTNELCFAARHLRACVDILLQPGRGCPFGPRQQRGNTDGNIPPPTGDLQEMNVEGLIGSVRWTAESADSTLFYGLAMDGTQGIILDNFSIRGSSGLTLRSIPVWMMHEFNEQRPYDLIILQYGLNVATKRGKNYDYYQDGMATTIAHLKEAFPQAGILVVSVGDRDYKTEEGDLRTMPGIKNLVRYQQNLAADNAVAFWNLFEAMSGEGSMVQLVHAKPSMANYDYTHINFRGGKHLAGLLYEALIYGKEQYDRRRAYEME